MVDSDARIRSTSKILLQEKLTWNENSGANTEKDRDAKCF